MRCTLWRRLRQLRGRLRYRRPGTARLAAALSPKARPPKRAHNNDNTRAQATDTIPSGATCVVQCADRHSPEREELICHAGVLSPATTTCRLTPCTSSVKLLAGTTRDLLRLDAKDPICDSRLSVCVEGCDIRAGAICRPSCAAGFTPSESYLECVRATPRGRVARGGAGRARRESARARRAPPRARPASHARVGRPPPRRATAGAADHSGATRPVWAC